MKILLQKIYNLISYEKKHQRDLNAFEGKVKKYLEMDELEFKMEYINISSKYEHKKLIFTVMIIAIIITLMTNVWTFAFDVIMNLFSLNGRPLTAENQLAGIQTITVVALSITILVLVILHKFIKDIHFYSHEKIFLDEMKEMRL